MDGAKVTSADHTASNGVIHVIDRVMYPLPEKDIPTVLTEMSQFGTLLYAVSQGQLVGPLQGEWYQAGTFRAQFHKVPWVFCNLILN